MGDEEWDEDHGSLSGESDSLQPLRSKPDRSFEHIRGASARAGVEYEQSVSGQSVLYAEAEALRNRSPTNTEFNVQAGAAPMPIGASCCPYGAPGQGMYAP